MTRSPGPRWDAAERNVILSLARLGMPDVFRTIYGYEAQNATRALRRGSAQFPRRFDHVFATASASVSSMSYRHEWRETGLSDHSGIELEITDAG
jgi:endonuclease/exonuclease/phosphatase family metal-dependent hydrolase